MIRKDNDSNNSLFLSCQMALSDGVFLMIKHTPLPNGNHPISIPICPMGVADMLEPGDLIAKNLTYSKGPVATPKNSQNVNLSAVEGKLNLICSSIAIIVFPMEVADQIKPKPI